MPVLPSWDFLFCCCRWAGPGSNPSSLNLAWSPTVIFRLRSSRPYKCPSGTTLSCFPHDLKLVNGSSVCQPPLYNGGKTVNTADRSQTSRSSRLVSCPLRKAVAAALHLATDWGVCSLPPGVPVTPRWENLSASAPYVHFRSNRAVEIVVVCLQSDRDKVDWKVRLWGISPFVLLQF